MKEKYSSNKMIVSLEDKCSYTLHGTFSRVKKSYKLELLFLFHLAMNLQLYTKLGLKCERITKAVKFTQKKFAAPFVTLMVKLIFFFFNVIAALTDLFFFFLVQISNGGRTTKK